MGWLRIAKLAFGVISIIVTSVGGEHLLNHTDPIGSCLETIKSAVTNGQLSVNYVDPQSDQKGSNPDDDEQKV